MFLVFNAIPRHAASQVQFMNDVVDVLMLMQVLQPQKPWVLEASQT